MKYEVVFKKNVNEDLSDFISAAVEEITCTCEAASTDVAREIAAKYRPDYEIVSIKVID
jgi:hypothetical protein